MQLTATDCVLGSLRRVILSVDVDSTDSVLLCGTQTGDLLEVNATNGRFIRAGPNRFSQGITVVQSIAGVRGAAGSVLLGNGDGSVVLADAATLRVKQYVPWACRTTPPPQFPVGGARVPMRTRPSPVPLTLARAGLIRLWPRGRGRGLPPCPVPCADGFC
jgi:hypothetical protein